ncbi:hypothetical protein [Vreelandella olivaria]|nr:hypothetical protein [Halomonas olivaria]
MNQALNGQCIAILAADGFEKSGFDVCVEEQQQGNHSGQYT